MFVASLTNEDIWLGGNDLSRDARWVWTDGSPFTYQNWGWREPNNFGVEECMELRNGIINHQSINGMIIVALFHISLFVN